MKRSKELVQTVEIAVHPLDGEYLCLGLHMLFKSTSFAYVQKLVAYSFLAFTELNVAVVMYAGLFKSNRTVDLNKI